MIRRGSCRSPRLDQPPQRLVCRGCEEHSECASNVCKIEDRVWVDQTEIVYADPMGDSVSNC